MTESQKNNQARMTLAAVENALRSYGWNYRPWNSEYSLVTQGGLECDGWECDIGIRVRANQQALTMIFQPPIPDILKNKPVEAAVAVCAANASIPDGCFNFDVEEGRLYFRVAHWYGDCAPGPKLIESMLSTGLNTVSHYMEDFRNIANGRLAAMDFVERERG